MVYFSTESNDLGVALTLFGVGLVASIWAITTDCAASGFSAAQQAIPTCHEVLGIWFVGLVFMGLSAVVLAAGIWSDRQRPKTAPASARTSIPPLIACRSCGRVYPLGKYERCPSCKASLRARTTRRRASS